MAQIVGSGARVAGRRAERLVLRLLGVTRARPDYTISPVRVPMRDGVELAADLYRPSTEPLGTLLVRGPYGRSLPFSLLMARIFAARGYRVLFVSSRGTFGSGGEFDPMRDEAADGQDVVAWMREQPWFSGTFGTLGGSYLGHTQWALLADPPPELAAAVISVGPHDFSRHAWGTGAFNLDLLEWSDGIAHQEEARGLRAAVHRARSRGRLRPVLDALPLADAAEAHFAGGAPWYRHRVTRPDLTDPYWKPMQHAAALERTSVPVLLISGWQDLFLDQTVEQYTRLHERGVDVALTIGPWTHIQVMSKGARTTTAQTLDWLDEHIAGRGGRRRPAPVRIHVTGAGQWRDLPAWPPPGTAQTLHLHHGGDLLASAPAGDAASTFTFDPADPTPTFGGPILAGGGMVDDGRLAARPDVLAFTSDPLEHDLEVLGGPEVELAHSTDNPHADLFVRLSEVDAKGRSRNVTEAYQRLAPDREPGPVRLALRHTAHRFRAGHRLRLLVAGGSHPQFARNLGTGENPGTGSTLKPATHTIRHGDGEPSRLVLPVAGN
ncbi:CocE/NonD family hydrolase [Actinomadura rugatobispora]|uniref:CocE/NonD family hydrolase n=1 Tax=Actinomadura rugatobispora TaxID=1994 RepID=A0ABW0ZZH8_9ACTN|nr:CocE/NonD family hydrolase [Actinomadura rugatobispora]